MFKECKGSLDFRREDFRLFRDTLGGVQESWLISKDPLLKTQSSPFQQVGNKAKAAGDQRGQGVLTALGY